MNCRLLLRELYLSLDQVVIGIRQGLFSRYKNEKFTDLTKFHEVLRKFYEFSRGKSLNDFKGFFKNPKKSLIHLVDERTYRNSRNFAKIFVFDVYFTKINARNKSCKRRSNRIVNNSGENRKRHDLYRKDAAYCNT